jgi:hypothetical protein
MGELAPALQLAGRLTSAVGELQDHFFASELGVDPISIYLIACQVWNTIGAKAAGVAGRYEFSTGKRPPCPGDFEGGKTGAVRVLEKLGFDIRPTAEKPG